jgi:histidinol-phosphatase (PHP family)
MLGDYHVHIDKLEWSIETIKEICEKAADNGVDRVGLVVHTKVLDGFQPLYSHILSNGSEHKKLKFDKDINQYISLISSAKGLGCPVDLGVEVCYFPQGQQFLGAKLNSYPFDYKIGSVHLIGDKHYKTALEYYKDNKIVGRKYYELVLKAAESGLFDIIGHIEVPRREGIPGLDQYPGILEQICYALVKNNCAVEINTKWLVKHDRIVPDLSTLKYMMDKGVKLVFGSDAHHIDRIGYALDDARTAIVEAGYKCFSLV